MAACSVSTCKYGKDKCRNTDRYSNVGQNIAEYSDDATEEFDHKEIIYLIVQSWIEDRGDVKDNVDSYQPSKGFVFFLMNKLVKEPLMQ